jgi:hypothetical protein
LGYLILIGSNVYFYFNAGLITDDSNHVIAAFAVLLLYIKVFYYLRIFRSFTTFIRMIEDMFHEMKIFGVISFLLIAAFANVFMVLNYNRDPDEAIYETYVDSAWVNSILHTYMTGLGEFGGSQFYSSENKVTLWFLFFMATFLIHVLALNLLIAIMSESFSKLNDNT